MPGPEHDFHFATLAAAAVLALVLGPIAFLAPFAAVVAGVGVALTARGCVARPRRIGLGRVSLPVGRLDALFWLSVAPVCVFVGVAAMRDLPPGALLGP